MITMLTRRYRFCASHRLHAARLSDAENAELYGKCNNPFGHGHDYILDVTVSGPVDGQTGKLCSLDTLDRLVQDSILADFNHRNLNLEIPEFQSLVPTTENISVVISKRLSRVWNSEMPVKTCLARIYIEETARNSFEVDFRPALTESIHV